MKTRFTKKILSILLALLMVITTIPATAISAFAADDERYLFAYFTGNGTAGTGANTQEIRFATSTDGISFTPLLNNNSAITQRGGTGNVRDPFIFKGHDGFYYIVGTDLNATTMGFWGNQPQIVFWKSADLITWTDETYINTAQICGLNNDQVQRTWAPEVIWDDALGKYMVYFAFAADGYNSTTMYYMTTSDLLDQSKYSKPQQLYAPGGDAIDADIIKQDSTYYMFYKDETEGRKNVCLATATSVTGPYTYQGVFGTSSQTGAIEGCEVFMIGSNYHLVADRYGDNGKFAIYNLGTDLSKLTGKATINMTDGNPVKTVNATTGYSNLSARHGSIIHISDAQCEALKNNAPHSVGKEVAVNGSGIASQIQSNLVAHYLISNGDQRPDFSGKNHNANTLDTTNTVWQNSGNYPYSGVTNIQGLYFKLNNEHDYFKAPIGDMFSKTNLDQGFTVSFMAKPDTGIDDVHSHFFEIISTSGNITWDGEASTAHQYLGWFTSGNVEVVTSRRDLNGGSYANFGTRTAEKDAWHTYTLTLKRDEVKAYIDGELVGSTTANANAMLWNGLTGADAVLRIGNTAWPDNDYKGYMRDFRIYNKALSEEEAAQMGATHKTFAQNQKTADAVAGIYAAQNNQFKGSVVPYANNVECYNGYANVLYSSNTWVDGNAGSKYQNIYDGTTANYLKPAMLGMSDIVLLYDGKNDTAFPFIFKCQESHKNNCVSRYRWDYLASEHADWTIAKNNQVLINAKAWNTFQTSSKEFSISTNINNETNTGNNNNNKCTNEWPWQGACYFQGSFADGVYSKTYTNTITFKGKCDIRLTWTGGSQWNENKLYTDMKYGTSGTESKTVRVVNYKPIADKMDAVIAKFDAVRNAQNPNYGAAELKEYYEAVAEVTKNPNSFFADTSNLSTCITNYENWIKSAIGSPMTRALAGPREHSFVETTISPATCTDAGLKKITCSNTGCDYEKLETVAALGHIKASSETKANEVAATCETAGSYDMQYLCTRCNAVLSSRTVAVVPLGHKFTGAYYKTYTTDSLADADVTYQHYQKCANNEEHTNPTGCNWVPADNLSYDATAEAKGRAYERCSVCGGTRYTETTYNAVKYNITFTMNAGYGEEAKSQTIEVEEGQTPVAPFTLPNAKYHYDDVNEYTYSWPTLAAATGNTEYVAIVTPKAHVYNDDVTLPTCGVAGYTTRTCTNANCGHSYVTAPTEALTHNYGAWTSDAAGHHKKVCLNDCGDVIQEDCAYELTEDVAATCTAQGHKTYTCPTCGYSYTEYSDPLGHDIQTVYKKATCTEAGYYSVTCTRGDMTNSDKYPMAGFEYRTYDPNTTAYIDWQGSSYDNKVETFTLSIGVEIDRIEISFKQTYNNHVGGNTVRWRLRDGNGTEIVADSVNQSILSSDKYIEKTVTVNGNKFTVEAPDFGSNDRIQFLSIKVYPKMPAGWTSADYVIKSHNYKYRDNGDGATHTKYCDIVYSDGSSQEVIHDASVAHTYALAKEGNNVVQNCTICDYKKVVYTDDTSFNITCGNMFSFDSFAASTESASNPTNGKAYYNTADKSVTLTGTGDNYTSMSNANDTYRVTVEGGKSYTFEYKTTAPAYSRPLVFVADPANANGWQVLADATANNTTYDKATDTYKATFTVPAGLDTLFFRYGTQSGANEQVACTIYDVALYPAGQDIYVARDVASGTDYATAVAGETISAGIDGFCKWNVADDATVTNNMNVDYIGHDIVIDQAVAPTCIETGLTEGSHCSRCNQTIVEQEEIAATGVHSYTGKSVHTDADGEANGYTEYRCVNGCNELGGRVYDAQDWDAYDAAITTYDANAANTAKYTAASIADYQAAVEAIKATVDKEDQTKSQAYIDSKVSAIEAAADMLKIAKYNVTFNIRPSEGAVIYTETFENVDYGATLDFDAHDHMPADSFIYKWIATSNASKGDSKINSSAEKVSYVIYDNTTINCYITQQAKESENLVKVTLKDKSNNVTGIAYVASGSTFTKDGNVLTVDGNDLTAPKYPYYQIKDFCLEGSNTIITDNGYAVTEDIVVKPVYSAEPQIIISTTAADVAINNVVRSSYTAKWDQTITAYNPSATAWYANGVLVATGNTYKFQATQSVVITYSTDIVTEGKSRIDYAQYEAEFDYSRIVVSNCVPQGATVVEQGIKILTSSKENVPSVASSKVIAGTKKFTASKVTDTGLQFMFTLSTDPAVKTIAVVSFVTYELGGQTYTVWSSEGDDSATMIYKANKA